MNYKNYSSFCFLMPEGAAGRLQRVMTSGSVAFRSPMGLLHCQQPRSQSSLTVSLLKPHASDGNTACLRHDVPVLLSGFDGAPDDARPLASFKTLRSPSPAWGSNLLYNRAASSRPLAAEPLPPRLTHQQGLS